MFWFGVCVIGLIAYVGMTTNKKIIDTEKRFTHADVTTGNETVTYEIVNYDYPRDDPHLIKIWPDRSIDANWPVILQTSSACVRLYTLRRSNNE